MYYKILIPVDLAHRAELPKLVSAARQLTSDSPHADFNFLYVDDSGVHKAGAPYVDADKEKARRQDIKDKLLALVRNLVPEDLHCFCHVRRGTIHEQILEEAKKGGADVIVMMAQKPGLSSYFVGSNAERVVRHAQCSVMVVRD
ncbi:universal stress protein [Oceanobacter mangrovi]|uniref:universal stress protein n=1 Tax=Oceanobacter mangrovi TaxID=2862510 RepID=UPI001C8DD7FC|nr:universal stress protein [Oceanobacter mangrovi]